MFLQKTGQPIMLTNRDMVVVVDSNQISKAQVTSQTGSFTSHALHGTAISKEAKCVVVDKVKARLVEDRSGMLLGDRKTDCVSEPLAKRPGRDFDTWCVVGFGMSGGDAVDLLLPVR